MIVIKRQNKTLQPKKLTKKTKKIAISRLTISWRRPLPYRNQSIDLQNKLIDWFLYDNGLRH